MSEFYGATAIPLVAGDGTEAVGDRALTVLGSFFKTILNAKGTTAYQAIVSGGVPVKNVFTHDPADHQLNPNDLPSLYIFRQKEGVQTEWIGEDWQVAASKVTLLWLFPPVTATHSRLRDAYSNGVIKVIARGVERYTDPLWIYYTDLPDLDSIKTSAATLTSPVTYDSSLLNGVVGTGRPPSPRKASVTSAVAAGAYNTGVDISFFGLNSAGVEVTESVRLTLANGGETIKTTGKFARVYSITVGAQTLTTGTLQFGYAEDPQSILEGSNPMVHAGLMSLEMKSAKVKALQIKGSDGSPVRSYDAVEMTLNIEERWTIEDDDMSDPFDGIDVNITRSDGSLIEQASLDS